VIWRFARFEELTPREVHDILQARLAVFVIEQNCVFQDVDGADPACWHLLGNKGSATSLLAYCRIVPPGVKFAEPSIGRVITTAAARGTGAGRELMREAVARTTQLWPGQPIRIGAQAHLEKFYNEVGFVKASDPYDEDGILHIEMLRP
jgi:ElaA protein